MALFWPPVARRRGVQYLEFLPSRISVEYIAEEANIFRIGDFAQKIHRR